MNMTRIYNEAVYRNNQMMMMIMNIKNRKKNTKYENVCVGGYCASGGTREGRVNLFPRVSALCALFFLASKRLPCRLSDVKGGLT